MVTTLEIVDTVIKVGLGILLSSVATFLSLKSAQAYELRKAMRSEKVSLLREALVKLEESGSLLNELRQSLDRIREDAAPERRAEFHKALAGLPAAYNVAKTARSLCYLIGLRPLAGFIKQYLDAINELHAHYMSEGVNYSVEFVDANTDRLSAYKDQILEHLASAFEAIHA